VTVRLVGRAPAPPAARLQAAEQGVSRPAARRAHFGHPWGARETPVLARAALDRPTVGPVLIDEYDATIVVPPDFRAARDDKGNVVVDMS
jgi:N-methylhydantoinase A